MSSGELGSALDRKAGAFSLHVPSDVEQSSAGASSTPLFLIIVGIYVAIAATIVPVFRWQVSPDTISYISIAQKYLAGDIQAAINAYWSPLYSWLLMPLLVAGVSPLLATKVLAVFIGVGSLAAARKLAKNVELQTISQIAMASTLIPLLLSLGVVIATPDFLSAFIVLVYVAHLTTPEYLAGRFSGILSGILGGIAYLAKAYLMWFFLLHFVIVCVYWLSRRDRANRRILKVAVTGMIAFLLVVGSWSALLSHKYGRLTTGSTGAYNHALNGPTSPDHPMHTQGFLAPPNATAVSAWEDPTLLTLPKWNPLATKANCFHQLKLVFRNSMEMIRLLQSYSPLAVAVFVVSALVAGSSFDIQPRYPILLLVMTIVLYPLGYLLLHIESRFISAIFVLLLILAFRLFDYSDVNRLGRYRRLAAIAVLFISFAFLPLRSLWVHRGAGRDIVYKSGQLASVVPRGSKIASDTRWHNTLYLAFHCGLTYYGESKPKSTAADVYADLMRHHIEFFFVWGDPQEFPFTKNCLEVSEGRDGQLRIYRIPSGTPQLQSP